MSTAATHKANELKSRELEVIYYRISAAGREPTLLLRFDTYEVFLSASCAYKWYVHFTMFLVLSYQPNPQPSV